MTGDGLFEEGNSSVLEDNSHSLIICGASVDGSWWQWKWWCCGSDTGLAGPRTFGQDRLLATQDRRMRWWWLNLEQVGEHHREKIAQTLEHRQNREWQSVSQRRRMVPMSKQTFVHSRRGTLSLSPSLPLSLSASHKPSSVHSSTLLPPPVLATVAHASQPVSPWISCDGVSVNRYHTVAVAVSSVQKSVCASIIFKGTKIETSNNTRYFDNIFIPVYPSKQLRWLQPDTFNLVVYGNQQESTCFIIQ